MEKTEQKREEMTLEQLLFSQGFGTRRDCRDLVRSGAVVWQGETAEDPAERVSVAEGDAFSVRGEEWRYYRHVIIAMNKPAGYECSTKPRFHPGILTILPPPLRARNVQPVGRLDEDTTGLLILTDDGAFQHWLIHPKHHVEKVYRTVLKHPVTDEFIQKLKSGVVLDDDPVPVKAEECVKTGECEIEMTLTQGKYHQVKRMAAAAGNRVEKLERIRFGVLTLPENLAPGEWVWLAGREAVTGKKNG